MSEEDLINFLTHFVSHVLICLFLIHLFSTIISPHQCHHHHSCHHLTYRLQVELLLEDIWLSETKCRQVNTLCCLWIGNPSQSYGASPAIWDHTVLPATRHRWTRPALTSAMQAGTRFTYPGGMEGWVHLGVGYIPRWFTCRRQSPIQVVTTW